MTDLSALIRNSFGRGQIMPPFGDLSRAIGSENLKLAQTVAGVLGNGCTPDGSYLTGDTSSHVPPTSGTFTYNTFQPGASGFPALAGTYTDPVFGGVVHRLSNHGGASNTEQIYAHHWANADGTMYFVNTNTNPDMEIRRFSDSAVVAAAPQPVGLVAGADTWWDMLDPDIYYFCSGTKLQQRKVSTLTTSTKKDFGGSNTLQNMGGSHDIQTADGRLFIVCYGNNVHVWDSQTDTVYSGTINGATAVTNGGYLHICPSGNQVIVAGNPSGSINTYTVDVPGQAVSTTAKLVWSQCGDHAAYISTDEGHDYGISFNCNNGPGGMYRFDLSVARTTESAQMSNAQSLILWGVNWYEGHLCAVSTGAKRNWVFMDVEWSGDTLNGNTTGWQAYRSEVIAMNLVTLEVRRFCHHRSRNNNFYYNQPRISCSADGTKTLWMSNYNVGDGICDTYGLFCPLA